MSDENGPYAGSSDDPIGGPRTPQQQQSQAKIKQTQAKVDEVVGIMRVNVEKVLERDSKLTELGSRADALQQGACQFEQQAQKLKRKYFWKNIKMMIIIGAVAAVILIIIIVWATSGMSSDDSSSHDDSSSKVSHVTTAPPALHGP